MDKLEINDVLIIDVDTNRENTIIVQHGKRKDDDVTQVSGDYCIINDMAILCEAICLLIHSAEKQKIKPSPDSLRDCIKHLENGFADASYNVETTIDEE